MPTPGPVAVFLLWTQCSPELSTQCLHAAGTSITAPSALRQMPPLCKRSLNHHTHFPPVVSQAGATFPSLLFQGPPSVCLAFLPLSESARHTPRFPPVHRSPEGSSTLLSQGVSLVSGFQLPVLSCCLESLSHFLLLPRIQCNKPFPNPQDSLKTDIYPHPTAATQ